VKSARHQAHGANAVPGFAGSDLVGHHLVPQAVDPTENLTLGGAESARKRASPRSRASLGETRRHTTGVSSPRDRSPCDSKNEVSALYLAT